MIDVYVKDPNEIRKYYEDVDLKPLFNIDKNFFKFRQLRFRLEDGRMIKVNDTIKNESDLRKAYLRWLPTKAYYTVSRFINAPRVGKKKIKSLYGQGLFIKQDRLVLDIDKNAIENIKRLIDDGFSHKIEYICFSGQKGVHVSLKLLEQSVGDLSILQREEYYRMINRNIIDSIKINHGVDVDTTNGNCINTRQIMKIPLSLSNGVVCNLVGLGDLEMVEDLICKQFTSNQMKRDNDQLKSEGKTRMEFPSLNTQFPVIITNQIDGCKGNYILANYFDVDYGDIHDFVYLLIKKFKLSDVYIFNNIKNSLTYIISLKKLQKHRDFKRIQKDCGRYISKSYRYNFINLNDLVYLKKIEGLKLSDSQISLEHKRILNETFGGICG